MPNIEGLDSFESDAFHTGLWPHEPVEFAGKRIAVIGTGATPAYRDKCDEVAANGYEGFVLR